LIDIGFSPSILYSGLKVKYGNAFTIKSKVKPIVINQKMRRAAIFAFFNIFQSTSYRNELKGRISEVYFWVR
jgi:hypothetical protein